MNEMHQARAPTVPRTGRPNREPLDADAVIAYALALAGDLGVSIPKRKRLYRMLKRRIPIPQIYQGADYRLWVVGTTLRPSALRMKVSATFT